MIQAADGDFYGTTLYGGDYAGGSVFELTPIGKFTNVYSFDCSASCGGGAGPGSLMQGADGHFFGTTFQGGANFWGHNF
jgi:uncharacterized repeat protein (TIGR03803 family)